MDVRCEKCDTIYELEDSRVGDSGVDVQCTRCGHIFRARRRPPLVTKEIAALRGATAQLSSITPAPGGEPTVRDVPQRDRPWYLRLRRTEEVLRFHDLALLRQWIIDKRVTRDDDISRGGQSWRRLGSIVELEAFFYESEQAVATRLRTGQGAIPSGSPTSSPTSGNPPLHEPRRLRSNTPGLGIGPPLSGPQPPSSRLLPDRPSVPTFVGPGAARPPEEGAPLQPLRLSSTGRTMRPRLSGESSGLIVFQDEAPPSPPSQQAPSATPQAPAAPPQPTPPPAQEATTTPLKDRLFPRTPEITPVELRGPTPTPAPAAPAQQEPPDLSHWLEDEGPQAIPDLAEVILRSDPVPRSLRDSQGQRVDAAPAKDRSAPHPAPPIELDEDEVPAGLLRPRTIFMALAGAALTAALLFIGHGLYQRLQGGPGQASLFAPAPPQAEAPALSMSMSGPGAAAYAQGLRHVAGDTDEEFRLAHDLFLRASGADEGNPRPLSALAELHGVWAHRLTADARRADPALRPILLAEAGRHAEQARDYASQAQRADRAAPEVNRALAVVMIQSGVPREDIEPALSRASQAEGRDAGQRIDPDLAYARALLEAREGRMAEAQALLARAVSSAPSPGPPLRVLMLLGEIAAQAGRLEEAERFFLRVRERKPGHKRAEEALRRLRQAAVDGGTAADAAQGEASSAADGGAAPAAAQALPRDHAEQLKLAERLLDKGRAREAQRLYQQMLPAHDADPAVHVGLGLCAVETERYQAAIEHYQTALQRRADHPDALIGLAEAYKLRGSNDQALRTYRTYLEKHPGGPQANLARNNVERLEAILGAEKEAAGGQAP